MKWISPFWGNKELITNKCRLREWGCSLTFRKYIVILLFRSINFKIVHLCFNIYYHCYYYYYYYCYYYYYYYYYYWYLLTLHSFRCKSFRPFWSTLIYLTEYFTIQINCEWNISNLKFNEKQAKSILAPLRKHKVIAISFRQQLQWSSI